MLITLMALAIVVFFVGTEYIPFIIIAFALLYLYPVQAILLLIVLGYLKWQGDVIKRKLANFIKSRRPK